MLIALMPSGGVSRIAWPARAARLLREYESLPDVAPAVAALKP
jgi:hypothetical protein